MACVLPFLIVPVAIGDISPDFDVRAATERGVRLLNLAQPNPTASQVKGGIRTRFDHAFQSGKGAMHFEVRSGKAFVRFSARTGKVEVTFHPRNIRAGSQNLDRTTREGIARAFIKECGWDGGLLLGSQRESGTTDSSEDDDFLFYP